ncbi:TetR/AcrR family transcriptional regulator [Rhodococcus sp. MSC1_016]|jgi:AcrR family transcriptional regulator|uniref:TetR/AcrR family transcriptional regulator n=1 Tax=Rhodococcus sp. MSC1_016 TaxID=2909266 RepID=UPI00202E4510|nr:TetR/AcrR family transcriptional regulator C-terminal domain-containing protein [Rhodococcus sp. MSC1_016]
MGRPRIPLLSRERIVSEAMAMIDEEGVAALSTRKLAARLGVQGPSLYNHFKTMDEVTDAVVDAILDTVDTEIFETAGWRTALPIWARNYWSALQRHPGIVPLLARGPATRPSQLRLADAFYGSLTKAGWPPRQATEVAIAVRNYIAGSALGSYFAGFTEDPSFYAGQYPHLSQAHLLPKHAELDTAAFERGLSCLIDGLTLQYSEIIGLGATR